MPTGVSSLDENTKRCKGRTKVWTYQYIPSKPVKFGVRFYAIVGWSFLYLHTLNDDGSCKKEVTSAMQRFVHTFRSIRGWLKRSFNECEHDARGSVPALCTSQVALLTFFDGRPGQERLQVTDKYYMKPSLARQIHSVANIQAKLLGRVRINFVGAFNKKVVKRLYSS